MHSDKRKAKITDHDAFGLEERPGQHHRRFFVIDNHLLAEAVRLVHVVVVIFRVPRARVIGRIDVDDVDLAPVAVKEELQRVEICQR